MGSPGRIRSGGTRSQRVTERITVALLKQVARELRLLQRMTGLSKTDIVNRAISLYLFIVKAIRNNQDILLQDRSTGETQLIRLQ